MKVFRNCLAIVLTVLTSALIIFLPHFDSLRSERALLNNESYRKYQVENDSKLEKSMVAEAFLDIGELYFVFFPNYKPANNAEKKNESLEILNEIFLGSDELITFFNNLFHDSQFYCSTNNALVMINEKPTALVFVSANLTLKEGSLDFVYEQKTGTLLNLSLFLPYDNEKINIELGMQKALESYCSNELDLENGEFWFIYETTHDDLFLDASFGISEIDEEKLEAEKDTYNIPN